jgi:hypothetical protein
MPLPIVPPPITATLSIVAPPYASLALLWNRATKSQT